MARQAKGYRCEFIAGFESKGPSVHAVDCKEIKKGGKTTGSKINISLYKR